MKSGSMFARIFIGLILCALGFGITKKPQTALDFIGPIAFAEKAFSGGSFTFYKLFGIVLILVGFLVMTNLHVSFFGGMFNFFFGR